MKQTVSDLRTSLKLKDILLDVPGGKDTTGSSGFFTEMNNLYE